MMLTFLDPDLALSVGGCYEPVASTHPDRQGSDVYICGAGPWMHAVRRAARAAKVPARQIHLESFGW